jgi:hypothetical protein
MSVFDVAVDTVLVCYVTDCDENVQRGGKAIPVHFKTDALFGKIKGASGGASDVSSKRPGSAEGRAV